MLPVRHITIQILEQQKIEKLLSILVSTSVENKYLKGSMSVYHCSPMLLDRRPNSLQIANKGTLLLLN
jgi:hypothetical protein